MSEEVSVAQLKRMRRLAENRGNTKEVERIDLSIRMKEGIYPPNRTHKNRHDL